MDPGGQIDFQQLIAAAAEMQSQLMSAQQQLAETEIEGTAGGGLVKATVNGQGELLDLTIAADAIDPGDPQDTAQTVADLVLAACRDAYRQLADIQATMMGPLAGGFEDLGGGSGIPGLPGFPGLPGSAGSPGQPPLPGSRPSAGGELPGGQGDGSSDSPGEPTGHGEH